MQPAGWKFQAWPGNAMYQMRVKQEAAVSAAGNSGWGAAVFFEGMEKNVTVRLKGELLQKCCKRAGTGWTGEGEGDKLKLKLPAPIAAKASGKAGEAERRGR